MIKRCLSIAIAWLSLSLPAAPRWPRRGAKSRCSAPHADITDLESLQRGARDFMNYCSGCHSIAYLRYNRHGGGSEDSRRRNLPPT